MGIIEEIKRLAAGAVIVRESVDPITADQRMLICRGCNKADLENDKCLQCGCFLSLKTGAKTNWRPSKSRNEITHCPLGKWGDLEIANAYRIIDGLPIINI
jgi:hypothetical protein